MRLLLLISAALLSLPLLSMPTEQELAKAEPLIQELMRDDLNAVRMGKKTREQVGDAAVSLAMEAQTPAEKYLLFTGAFDQYMRGGLFEKADVVLDALHKAIPDWKSSDEFALIDKAMRVVAFGKGGPVRERYESLKGRQQYAAKLKKAQAQAKAKPSDKKLQFQVAAYHAALDDWPAALDGFLAGSNPACAAAAKLEKGSAAPAQTADAWWSAADVKPDFLSSAIRAHAVELYKKALADPAFAGLQKVAAERRVQEFESAASADEIEPRVASYGSKKNPYVTKGLVAMWDGEWNDSLGKHDAKATKWKDIVGKSDCDPVGAPKFSNKSVVFDGNSYLKVNPSPELQKAVQNAATTCEIVVRFGKGATAKDEGIIAFGKNRARALWVYAGGAPMGAHATIAFQYKNSSISAHWQANGNFDGLHTIVLSVDKDEVLGWIDARQQLKSTAGVASNPEPCFIGYMEGWNKMVGEIYCIRIYDRALDARELQSNHAIDKRRFQ